MVSPADSELIAGGSDERRRFMDVVISVSYTHLDVYKRQSLSSLSIDIVVFKAHGEHQ